jgi:hypothetical protein
MRKLYFILAFACFSVAATAQTSRINGFIGAGFTEPVKDIGTRLDMGWNVAAGAGVNLHRNLGVNLDFMFNDNPINRATLDNQQVPDGTVRVWGFTVDPIIHFNGSSEARTDFYLTGGGGIYHRTVEFTQPAVTTVTVFDPFFGVIYPANIGVNQVIASRSNYKGGLDIGGGVSYRIGSSRAKLFAEARYHHIYTRDTPTTLLPVTFGIRW